MDATAFRGGNFGGHTTVSHQSVCGKLCNSLVGVVIGVVLFLVGFPVLAWNENNFVRVWESLSEGLNKVESVPDAGYLDTTLSGELVHVSGPLSNVPILRDQEFGVSARGVRLERVVEMYQYKEHRNTRKQRTASGGERSVTTYSYSQEWSSGVVRSNSFHDPSYSNPGSMPFIQHTVTAPDVTVGAYQLTSAQVGQLGSGTTLPMSPSTLAVQGGSKGAPKKSRRGAMEDPQLSLDDEEEEDPWAADLDDYGENDYDEPTRRQRTPPKRKRARGGQKKTRRGKGKRSGSRSAQVASLNDMVPSAPGASDLIVTSTSLYLGVNPARPEVGDTRITWRVVNPDGASLVGKQRGARVVPFKTSNGYEVYLVSGGQLTAEEMFESAQTNNTIFTWLLRGGGWLLMFIGLRMVVEPAVLAPQLIPCVGGFLSDILACGACIATCSTASVVALVTIAVAWFAVRPTLSAGLLVVAAVVVLIARSSRQGGDTNTRGASDKQSKAE